MYMCMYFLSFLSVILFYFILFYFIFLFSFIIMIITSVNDIIRKVLQDKQTDRQQCLQSCSTTKKKYGKLSKIFIVDQRLESTKCTNPIQSIFYFIFYIDWEFLLLIISQAQDIYDIAEGGTSSKSRGWDCTDTGDCASEENLDSFSPVQVSLSFFFLLTLLGLV